ncbi:hypothetical protein F5Y15DRAFT_412963 [Xylariaceae sp. FL0016]|nr:hypothetical protein F5Y15DRAFT_412963 [Xylariaceae sp. FL0016]
MEDQPIYIPMTADARGALIAITVLWVVSAAVVFFRVLGRYTGVGIGADDVLATIALLLSAPTLGLNGMVFTAGVGYNLYPTVPEYPKLINNMPYIMKSTFAFEIIYMYCLACMKLSQLFLYRRMFGADWGSKVVIYVSMGVVAAWVTCYTFLFVFLCDPIEQQWTLERIGHCMDQITVLKSLILTNVLTDLLIILLPLRTVWQLQMRVTEKVVLTACFGLGIACIVVGIVRFVWMYQIDLTSNLTGTSLNTFWLCTLELMFGVLCTNIPMLRPFYRRWKNRWGTSKLSNTDQLQSNSAYLPTIGGTDGSQNWGNKGHSSATANAVKDHWFEMQTKLDDKNSDDGDSQRNLTTKPSDAIAVHTQWAVTRD